MGNEPCKECVTTEKPDIKDDCDPNVNGGGGNKGTTSKDHVPYDYDDSGELGFRRSALEKDLEYYGGGGGEARGGHALGDDDDDDKTTTKKNKKPSEKPTKKPPLAGRYSAKEIETKCKNKRNWCKKYMNCLRHAHEVVDIFPEMKKTEKVKLSKEEKEVIEEYCEKFHKHKDECEHIETEAKKGKLFYQLLDRLVKGTERSGTGIGSENTGLIIGGAITLILLTLACFLVYFFCKGSKKAKSGKRDGGSSKFGSRDKKSGLKSGRKSGKGSSKHLSSHISRSGRKSAIKSGKSKSKSAVKSTKSQSKSAAKSSKSKQKSSKKW